MGNKVRLYFRDQPRINIAIAALLTSTGIYTHISIHAYPLPPPNSSKVQLFSLLILKAWTYTFFRYAFQQLVTRIYQYLWKEVHSAGGSCIRCQELSFDVLATCSLIARVAFSKLSTFCFRNLAYKEKTKHNLRLVML
jgi:hypothetical protein